MWSKLANRLAFVFLFALLAPVGCLGDFGGTEDPASAERALYGNHDYYWDGAGTSRIDINVCWENPGAATDSWRNARRRAVESSWGRLARINFYQWDTCTAAEPGLHVRICTGPDQTGCDAYPRSQGTQGKYGDGVDNGIELNISHGTGVAIHEFGHCLGFYHAEERPDYDGTATGPGNCAKQTFDNANPQYYGAYDKTSNMSYCDPMSTLSPTDIAGVQYAYGRRLTGSLVSPQGNCAASHYAIGAGDSVFLWDCDEAFDDQEWLDSVSRLGLLQSLRRPFSVMSQFGAAMSAVSRLRAQCPNLRACLSRWRSLGVGHRYLYLGGEDGWWCMSPVSATHGSQVKLERCRHDTDWAFENVSIRGFGGQCLDLRAGNTTNGTPIQMWTCGALGGANQRWSISGNGQLRYGGLTSNKCARVRDGRLVIWDCKGGWSSQRFAFDDQRIGHGSQCLDVRGPSESQFLAGSGRPANGARVQTFACNSSMNQRWSITGPIRYGNDPSLCLSRLDGSEQNGTRLIVANCSPDADAQTWDYYF